MFLGSWNVPGIMLLLGSDRVPWITACSWDHVVSGIMSRSCYYLVFLGSCRVYRIILCSIDDNMSVPGKMS